MELAVGNQEDDDDNEKVICEKTDHPQNNIGHMRAVTHSLRQSPCPKMMDGRICVHVLPPYP